jgi:hypothetical protein
MGSEILKVPELELDKDECAKLADAIKDVSKYYVTAFDPKKIAWAHLAIIAGGIYGTRIFAVRNRKQLEKTLKLVAPKPSPKSTPANAGGQPVQQTNGIAVGGEGFGKSAPEMIWGTGEADL